MLLVLATDLNRSLMCAGSGSSLSLCGGRDDDDKVKPGEYNSGTLLFFNSFALAGLFSFSLTQPVLASTKLDAAMS